MGGWSFPVKHARVLLRIAPRPGYAAAGHRGQPGITGRSASGIVTGMTAAGYAVKHKDGHHNRYQIQARHPLPTCQPGTCHRRSPGPPGE
jgi:hypothetical protein